MGSLFGKKRRAAPSGPQQKPLSADEVSAVQDSVGKVAPPVETENSALRKRRGTRSILGIGTDRLGP